MTIEERYVTKLYIINNEEFTDYDFELINDEDMNDDIADVISEIANELYKEHNGQFKFLIEVTLKLTMVHDYFSGYDEELAHSYKILSIEESKYFDEV